MRVIVKHDVWQGKDKFALKYVYILKAWDFVVADPVEFFTISISTKSDRFKNDLLLSGFVGTE